jgi:hypothetical protein
MKTDQQIDGAPVFPQAVTCAVSELKNRLQREYERTYPELGDLVRIVLDEEEARAWELSFPHLFSPTWSKRTSANSACNPSLRETTTCLRRPALLKSKTINLFRLDVDR